MPDLTFDLTRNILALVPATTRIRSPSPSPRPRPQASGYYGFRKSYVANRPAGPIFRDARGVPEICWWFWTQEVRRARRYVAAAR